MESLRLQRGSLGSLLPLIRPLESPLLQRGPPGSPQPHGRPRGTLKPLQRLLESLYPRGPRKGGGNSTSPPRVGGADPRDLPIDKSAPMSVPEAVAPQGPYKERPSKKPYSLLGHGPSQGRQSHQGTSQDRRLHMGSLRGVGDPTGFSRGVVASRSLHSGGRAHRGSPRGGKTPMGPPNGVDATNGSSRGSGTRKGGSDRSPRGRQPQGALSLTSGITGARPDR
ncbi:uncharacterized protein LOC121875600 [Homarus americanus]|uniref:uncharacterized protein LOC121875600 n=1 Tax=Homarus americanus TaxID=6706 RepID=UPI001C44389B|nr:uncharacterized protein LOC121875600 [Homarus americanus]